jgi:hypothetical protein
MFGEMCVISLIYSNVAVCMFCAVRCVITICFYLLFANYWTCVFEYSLYVCFLFRVFCVFVLFCVLFLRLHIAVSLPSLYKLTDRCHRLEAQPHSINIVTHYKAEIGGQIF